MQVIISDKDIVANFCIEKQAYTGVHKIIKSVMEDMALVTGKKAVLEIGNPKADSKQDYVVAATVGKSDYLEGLQLEGKVDIEQIRGKREVYLFQLIREGKHNTLVIAGSDKRGTIYGLFHLSELMGISPWIYFADVMPLKKDTIIITSEHNMIAKEPSVKYRGFFINDEWPSFGNWTWKHFGGFTAEMYEKVFELLLRLKGNYLWPAMWTSSFSLDGPGLENVKLADEYGIVMSNSHHEPCLRHSEEWDIVKGENTPYGKDWNFDKNKQGLINYWRDGLNRNADYENIITIGMRGERDSEILGHEASLKENIDYLKEVIVTQNQLIRECVNEEITKVPRMLALYKEVEDFFYGDNENEGLEEWSELDGVTLLLCEDNFGNMRTLPEKNKRERNGGWGMYYHFDYHGDPVSYEWVNSTYLPKVWEQMTMAYEFGVRDIWIVNVGDIKPQELPISYFMDLAYDFEKWGTKAINQTSQYTRQWVEQQFGDAFDNEDRERITFLLEEYTRINSIRKPEALYVNVYHPVHYGETDRLLRATQKLMKDSERLLKKIEGSVLYAAFYELVYYPVVASMNHLQLHLYAGKNKWYAEQGRVIANDYADKITECIKKDQNLQETYHQLAHGKWDGMMLSEHVGFINWNDEECRYPIKHNIEPAKKPRMIVTASHGDIYTMGGDWTKKVIRVYDFLNPRCKYVSLEIANGSARAFTYQVYSEATWLEMAKKQDIVEKQSSLEIFINQEIVNVQCEKMNQDVIEARFYIKSEFASVEVVVYARKQELCKEKVVAELPDALRMYEKKDELGLVIRAHEYIRIESSHRGKFELLVPYGKYDSAIKAFPVTESYVPGVDAPTVCYEFWLLDNSEYEITIQCAPANPISKKKELQFGLKWNQEEIEIMNMVEKSYRGGDRSCREWAEGVLNNIHEKKIYKNGKKGRNEIVIYACDPAFVLERILIRKASGEWKEGFIGPL